LFLHFPAELLPAAFETVPIHTYKGLRPLMTLSRTTTMAITSRT
jgi:hypothetical protein